MNKKIVHDALILFAFTLVLGLLLGVVYGITKEPIAKVNYEKTQAAYKQIPLRLMRSLTRRQRMR